MDIATKVKVLAEMRAFGIIKLKRIGGSYSLIIPMSWVKIYGFAIEEDYYVKLDVVGHKLMLSLIDETELELINIKEKT